MLVGIADDEADGAARRVAFEDAAEQFYAVGLLAAGGDGALAGTPPVQFVLDEVHVDGDACRHAVNDTSYGLAMALAEGRQPEYIAKGIHFYRSLGV